MTELTLTESMEIELLQEEYKTQEPLADRLRSVLMEQIQYLLIANQITLGVPVESRVKSWLSIAEKIGRKKIAISRVNELDDFVGIRIIVLFKRDSDTVDSLIREHLTVLSSEDVSSRLVDDQFGYQSQHYIVQMPDAWGNLPTLRELSHLRAEIQLRTLTQHIWAVASHKLQYKQESSVPRPVLRTIYRVSALLETVDLEFERVLDERKLYIEQPQTRHNDEALNVDNLQVVLKELLPEKNIDENDDYDELLRDLVHFNVRSVHDLRDLISSNWNYVLDREISAVKNPGNGYEFVEDRLRAGVFYSFVGLARKALDGKFGEPVVSAWLEKNKKNRSPSAIS